MVDNSEDYSDNQTEIKRRLSTVSDNKSRQSMSDLNFTSNQPSFIKTPKDVISHMSNSMMSLNKNVVKKEDKIQKILQGGKNKKYTTKEKEGKCKTGCTIF